MKIAIAGATGLIGSRLAERLLDGGHCLILISRGGGTGSRWPDRPEARHFQLDLEREVPSALLDGVDALVNLAGTRIRSGRWTRSHREEIRNSRINVTRNLVRALNVCRTPPAVFISASATGYYGNRGNEILTEGSPGGTGFLARVARDWETEAMLAAGPLTRVVLLRSGPVLASGSGALAEIVKSFKMGFGAALGPGTQWMPWIHIDDVVGMIIWALQDGRVREALNGTAPDTRTSREVMGRVARELGKHLLFNLPAPVLQLALGEMAREMLLASQRVVPEKALNLGFSFAYPALEPALHDLLSAQPGYSA